jgi:hypothetical protein
MDRQQRIAIHKKQDRLRISNGVPSVSDLREGVPSIRQTADGLVEFIRYNNKIYKGTVYSPINSESTGDYVGRYNFWMSRLEGEPNTTGQWFTLATQPLNMTDETDLMMGSSGSDPSSTLDVSSTPSSHFLVPRMHYVPYDIEVGSCSLIVASDETTDNRTLKFRVCAYDIDRTIGAPGGDLSNGTVIMTSGDLDNDGNEQVYTYTGGAISATSTITSSSSYITIKNKRVQAGKVLLGFFSTDAADDYGINLQLNYRIV